MSFSFAYIFLLLSSFAISLPQKPHIRGININTAYTEQLQTWWHSSAEINTQSPVQPDNVRQSHLYSVQVGPSLSGPFYDSFVYETIPRGGKGNILNPTDPNSVSDDGDGVTIEPSVGITMAWSQFIYSTDVYVKISRDNFTSSAALDASNIVIRPTTLQYDVSVQQGEVYIKVHYSAAGSRFSVEFEDDLYSYHDGCSTTECGFVQSENSAGRSYVNQYTSDMPVMSVEPKNALSIFASPFLENDMIPDPTSSYVLQPQAGLISGLESTTVSTVYFNPGVYYMTATAHAQLSSSVKWVYFSPGSYVKGAFEFNTDAQQIKATGYGVLSGEQYVYQANVNDGYTNSFSNDDDLRMWKGNSVSGVQQTFILNGPTVAEPPFNSMDFRGDLMPMSVSASQYKQVGAWYGQTDGLENYPGSHISNVFYHSNDDTIKTYYSDVLVEDVVVWKGTTAPTIQFGWASRNISNILVQNIDIIHSRYTSNSSHPSLIGANQVYQADESATNTADTASKISNFTIKNVRSEGISGNLFRIVSLQNIEDFTIENVQIEEFPVESTGTGQSEVPLMFDERGSSVSITGFTVSGFEVGGTKVDFSADNWRSGQTGQLNIPTTLVSDGAVNVT